jgi:ribosomal-protein-alanine N-acetyltransferase
MHVRRMSPLDVAALAPCISEVLGGIDMHAELERALARAWVVEAAAGTGPLGFALVWHVVDEYQLLGIGTLPSARRQGAARALVEALAAEARRSAVQRISLEVAEGNVPARRLYEQSGFVVFNVRRGYYAKTREDALEMELVL